jgi:3-hydroxyisobutyrate dehydrogenase-like beta-hydroxyacid dehydrogenase
MAETITVIAAGEMGAAIGKRLSERGARVLTSLAGRGPGSAARAKQSNMTAIDDDDALVAQSDFILSVVPPGQALALAERLTASMVRAPRKPIYIDCNAVAPNTARRIGEVVAATNARYVDGGIIGPPPGPSMNPTLYLAGPHAHEARTLADYGLKVRVVEGDIGAASALKMSYAGITKGTQAIAAAMILGAARAGCAEALKQELSESQPQVLASLSRSLPRMFPKAYRWDAEMEEIAAFLGEDAAAHDVFLAFAQLYARIASGNDKSSPTAAREVATLGEFCAAASQMREKVS